MAHLTSAAALHCAREIIKAYAMEPRPPEELPSGRLDKLTAGERHVATLIDVATNAHEVVRLRPELHYWQRRLSAGTATAPQLASYLTKVLDALALVPRRAVDEAPVRSTFATYPQANQRLFQRVREIPKFALEATRVLFFYYRMEPRGRRADDGLDRIHVAGVVSLCLALSRVMDIEADIRRTRDALLAGTVSEEDVARFLRNAGVAFDRLPGYEHREEEVKILC